MTTSPIPGYLAVPTDAGPWPAVVVIAEAVGLNDDIRAHCDRLAAQGLLALAPDLINGRNKLRCVMRQLRELQAQEGESFDTIETARSWLAEHDDCTGRVGVIGFCSGGGFALLAAAKSDYHLAAANYGMLPKNPDDALRGICPVVASYGGRDRTLRGAADTLSSTLTSLGVHHDVHEYPDAGHAFLNDNKPYLIQRVLANAGFKAAESADAWSRINEFIDQYLRTPAGAAQ